MNLPLVSIIMPTYNAAAYISAAIDSVIRQTYTNWELLIIDDGSTDETKTIVFGYHDIRIRYYYQENSGVSVARNKGLAEMKGDFFCFLDADDSFPENGIFCRVQKFDNNPQIDFVDGIVETYDENFNQLIKVCKPSFTGNPFDQVVALRSNCLCAVSWMVRRKPGVNYSFFTGWSHSEDIAFYLSISADKKSKYDFVSLPVYRIRRRAGSAMSNLRGLEEGYVNFYKLVTKSFKEKTTGRQRRYLKLRTMRIMILSYLHERKLFPAIWFFFRFMFL
ncbi:MAG TPA: glycosyltransferase family 2 protein [Chitinophagaceae bacterium]|jgi:glycosyltransferase involved in cell wall biosynthesis|nr:glycosyltransferase family 2 protein [Chitinophagaceae bacterium]